MADQAAAADINRREDEFGRNIELFSASIVIFKPPRAAEMLCDLRGHYKADIHAPRTYKHFFPPFFLDFKLLIG